MRNALGWLHGLMKCEDIILLIWYKGTKKGTAEGAPRRPGCRHPGAQARAFSGFPEVLAVRVGAALTMASAHSFPLKTAPSIEAR